MLEQGRFPFVLIAADSAAFVAFQAPPFFAALWLHARENYGFATALIRVFSVPQPYALGTARIGVCCAENLVSSILSPAEAIAVARHCPRALPALAAACFNTRCIAQNYAIVAFLFATTATKAWL